MSGITVRSGRRSDAESLLVIHQESILRLGLTAYSADQCRSWAHGLTSQGYQSAMDAGEKLLVAARNSTLLGFCSYRGNEIEGLFVSPESSRHGIGTSLLKHVEADICETSVEEIVLDAALPAVPFYKTHGYGTRETSSWRTRGGVELEYYRMYKRVGKRERNIKS